MEITFILELSTMWYLMLKLLYNLFELFFIYIETSSNLFIIHSWESLRTLEKIIFNILCIFNRTEIYGKASFNFGVALPLILEIFLFIGGVKDIYLYNVHPNKCSTSILYIHAYFWGTRYRKWRFRSVPI